MIRQLSFSPDALTEIENAQDWYESFSGNVGARFITAYEKLLTRIASHPQHFPILYSNIHRARIHGFPYFFLFRPTDHIIQILAFFHTSQDPARWHGPRFGSS
ncbi:MULTISPECIES: type II toxin-antitoxin system RelE/ParE family toxin [Nitrospirillum]|uniref:type II toxin-antitoxin system RelE/ParE family toxin n=1 Tax=Nitrospirillum amazonense TaxID=28077 RepID=UPI0016447031